MSTLTLLQKTELRRVIDRQWSKYLTTAERAVLGFLFTTTIEWGRTADRLKSEHFTFGLGDIGGTGLSDKTVRRALDSLELVGAIVRRRTPHGYVLAIAFDWCPEDYRVPKKFKAEANNGMLATPKKPKVIGQNDLSRSVKLTDVYSKGQTLQEQTIPSRSPSAPGMGLPLPTRRVDPTVAARAVLDKAKADHKRSADQQKAKTSGKTNFPAAERLWGSVFREAYPEASAPAWSKRMQGNVNVFLKSNPHSANTTGLEVFEWVLRSWRTIINARFAWMTETPPPDLPDTGFMIRWKERFYEAWNERARLRQDLQVSGKDRRVRRLMHQGLTHDEANEEAGQRDALSTERAKVAETQRALNEMMRKAEQRATVQPENRFLRTPKPRREAQGPVRPGSNASGFGSLPKVDDDF